MILYRKTTFTYEMKSEIFFTYQLKFYMYVGLYVSCLWLNVKHPLSKLFTYLFNALLMDTDEQYMCIKCNKINGWLHMLKSPHFFILHATKLQKV